MQQAILLQSELGELGETAVMEQTALTPFFIIKLQLAEEEEVAIVILLREQLAVVVVELVTLMLERLEVLERQAKAMLVDLLLATQILGVVPEVAVPEL